MSLLYLNVAQTFSEAERERDIVNFGKVSISFVSQVLVNRVAKAISHST